jgi:hypothetical protein
MILKLLNLLEYPCFSNKKARVEWEKKEASAGNGQTQENI